MFLFSYLGLSCKKEHSLDSSIYTSPSTKTNSSKGKNDYQKSIDNWSLRKKFGTWTTIKSNCFFFNTDICELLVREEQICNFYLFFVSNRLFQYSQYRKNEKKHQLKKKWLKNRDVEHPHQTLIKSLLEIYQVVLLKKTSVTTLTVRSGYFCIHEKRNVIWNMF